MADLFTSLTTAARSLEAQRFALDATGQNIANVNTPGYTRRVVDLAAVPPDSKFSAGNGVTVTGVRSQRDALLERRLSQETIASAREAALADVLGVVETALGPSGESIDRRLSEFFDSFARLADDPLSPVARQEVALQGESLAAAMRDTYARLAQARRDANDRVGGAIDEINTITSRIATINDSIAGGLDPAALHLADEQRELVRQLSDLIDINVIDRTGGGVDIDVADGRPLIVGNTVYDVAGTAAGLAGMLQVTVGGADVTSEITGGKLGGLLAARDQRIPAYMSALDEQAYALAQTVNTIHSTGFDANGNTGQAFFGFTSAITGPAGAASALAVDAAIAADPGRIAAAGIAQPGDNRIARQLADARNARVLGGGTTTLAEGWSGLLYRVGRDTQTARRETTMRREVVAQVEALRDQVSGISLDEEAMQMMKFQRAYEANARFFRVIDQTLDVLLNTVAR